MYFGYGVADKDNVIHKKYNVISINEYSLRLRIDAYWKNSGRMFSLKGLYCRLDNEERRELFDKLNDLLNGGTVTISKE